jgi:uncharacterized membrane protein YsdA (DUF1294 family)
MRKMKYSSLFGILALVLVLVLYLPFYVSAQLPIYFAWLAGVSLTAFIFYGLDKSLSKIQRFTVRVPELILNLLALAGGFAGAWLGMAIWHHKTNFRRHWSMFLILVVSTLLHGTLIYLILTGGL